MLPGAAAVAVLAGRAIVPVAITGTEGIRLPGVVLRVAARARPQHHASSSASPSRSPSELTTASRATEASDYIMRRVAALLPESYRGAYGAGLRGQLVFRRSSDTPTATARPLES